MTDKRILKIILGILIATLLHNFYLNYEIIEVKKEAQRAKRFASSAEDYAREAAQNAKEASDNAFANNCRYCP